jgi:hypothetical protein
MNIAMLDPPGWAFWTASLAGEHPDTTPGRPHMGFFISKQYVSIPHGAKRVLTDFPVAIWFDGEKWWSRIDGLKNSWTNGEQDEVDELFGRVCRAPITHDKYLAMVATLEEWRKP